MPPLNTTTISGKQYWRSLDEIADTPEFREFMHHEFPAGATEMMDGGGRRQFLKIMAASMALAGMGLGGCRRWPQEKIAPFAARPAGRIPGKPVHYATCRPGGTASNGLLAASQDGRPIKVDGNPNSAGSRGRTTVFDQASVLDLYDPDRSRSVRRNGAAASWDAFMAEMRPHFDDLRRRQGNGLYVLSESSSSPTTHAMKRRLLADNIGAKWYEYEPLVHDNELQGTEMAFGTPYRPQYDLSKADYIVALDSDFLFDHGNAIAHIGDFAAGRRADGPGKSMNRLYSFEATLSLTGANADHRVAVRSADVALIAAYLGRRLLADQSLQRFEQHAAAAGVLDADVRKLIDEHIVPDLQKHAGHGLIVAGPRQPAEVHMLAHLMNHRLGNVGQTIVYTTRPDDSLHLDGIRALAAAIDAGEVDTLLIIGGNPAYNAPADLNLAEKLASAGTTIHLGDYVDETGSRCTWHVNRAHYLESWSDGRGYDGSYMIGQPIILPLFGGRSEIELLAALIGDGEPTAGYDLVRRTFGEMTGSDDEATWRRTLHDGVLPGSARTPSSVREATGIRERIDDLFTWWSGVDRNGHEIIFTADYSVLDGRFANNGWLQELPDPLTKLTWDNAAIMSPATAEQIGVSTGKTITIRCGETMTPVEVAVYVLPGLADGAIALPLGYGRTYEGRICRDAGFDFYRLRTTDGLGFRSGATVQAEGGSYTLATTQDHHSIDVETTGGKGIQDRLPTLIREGTLEEYRDHPNFAKHRSHVVHRLSMWDEDNLEAGKYAWGMSIDLSACVGCNACIIACQAENNIPIVGKDQVTRGREMHWIRLDRYFKFGEDEHGRPDASKFQGVALQPVNCMHCENAACEQVCPVAATVHDKDGLNVMVYNRCIGTRYCSNNCPYKVRRFNYFDYHRRDPARTQPGALLQVEPKYYTKPQGGKQPLQTLQQNPEVSVRVRGVMEKCTYCVQRITAARIDAKNEWVKLPEDDPRRQQERVPIPDGVVQTACEQACPAGAIVFGDLMDRQSRVARNHDAPRTYEMLEELNPKPRTKYMARLTNPAFGGSAHGHGHGHGNGNGEGAH